MLDKLLTNTYTKTDALKRLRLLKEFVILKLFGGGEQKFTLEDLAWLESFLGKNPQEATKDELFKNFQPNSVYHDFEDLENSIKNIQTLTIYLPISLPLENIVEIGKYLKESYGPNFLIDLKYDPTLVAGAALAWKGIYKDYSIKQKLQGNHEQILNLIKDMMHK